MEALKPAMHLFAYGSLMFPAVWEKVTGLTDPGFPAVLVDYSRRSIKGQSYPALVAEAGAVTEGVLYLDLPAVAVDRLDVFEGGFYDRIRVQVRLEDGRLETACVYLAADADAPMILPEPWDPKAFERDSLTAFLAQDPGFQGNARARILGSDS